MQTRTKSSSLSTRRPILHAASSSIDMKSYQAAAQPPAPPKLKKHSSSSDLKSFAKGKWLKRWTSKSDFDFGCAGESHDVELDFEEDLAESPTSDFMPMQQAPPHTASATVPNSMYPPSFPLPPTPSSSTSVCFPPPAPVNNGTMPTAALPKPSILQHQPSMDDLDSDARAEARRMEEQRAVEACLEYMALESRPASTSSKASTPDDNAGVPTSQAPTQQFYDALGLTTESSPIDHHRVFTTAPSTPAVEDETVRLAYLEPSLRSSTSSSSSQPHSHSSNSSSPATKPSLRGRSSTNSSCTSTHSHSHSCTSNRDSLVSYATGSEPASPAAASTATMSTAAPYRRPSLSPVLSESMVAVVPSASTALHGSRPYAFI